MCGGHFEESPLDLQGIVHHLCLSIAKVRGKKVKALIHYRLQKQSHKLVCPKQILLSDIKYMLVNARLND